LIWLYIVAGYFAPPALTTLLLHILGTARSYTWQGHLFFFLLWPIAWMFVYEELP